MESLTKTVRELEEFFLVREEGEVDKAPVGRHPIFPLSRKSGRKGEIKLGDMIKASIEFNEKSVPVTGTVTGIHVTRVTMLAEYEYSGTVQETYRVTIRDILGQEHVLDDIGFYRIDNYSDFSGYSYVQKIGKRPQIAVA